MATVYPARDRKLGRQVAVKVLHAELGATLFSRRQIPRFRQGVDGMGKILPPIPRPG
jgi:hypothetical protein